MYFFQIFLYNIDKIKLSEAIVYGYLSLSLLAIVYKKTISCLRNGQPKSYAVTLFYWGKSRNRPDFCL